MTEDIKENNQLVKAKTSSLQKRASNIVSRGLADLGLLDVNERKIAEERALLMLRKKLEDERRELERKIADNENLLLTEEWCKKNIPLIYAFGRAKLLQAEEWFEKGYNYCANKEYDEAIEAYTNAIALIEDYNKEIELNPNLTQAYNNRGNAYYNKGQPDRAIEDYNKAIDIKPNDVAAYNNRGLVYERLGDCYHNIVN